MSLKIEPIQTNKNKIKQRKLMQQGTIPKFASSIIINGKSGSGKSTLLARLMTEGHFYKGYFDYVLVFSPTGSQDDIIQYLELPEENIFTEFDESILENILESQKELIEENGVDQAPKICIIFDDIISDQKFLRTKIILKLFSMCRHYNIQVIINSQSWTKVPRALRLNCNGVFMFPASMSELDLICEEYCPPNLHKKDFLKVVQYATKERYNFLFINNHEHYETRYRKNLDEIINLDQFKTR